MAVTLGVKGTYCTAVEADLLLDTDSVWQAATDEQKDEGLISARYYIDITFSCDLSDYTNATIPEALKYANALLASDFVSDNTVFDSGVKIQEQEVEAGDVRSKKVFSTPKGNKPPSLNTVRGVLKDLCAYSGGIVSLIRA